MTFGTIDAGPKWEKVATVRSRSLAFLCLQPAATKEGTLLQKESALDNRWSFVVYLLLS